MMDEEPFEGEPYNESVLQEHVQAIIDAGYPDQKFTLLRCVVVVELIHDESGIIGLTLFRPDSIPKWDVEGMLSTVLKGL